MEQRLTCVTLGVADLARARAFYTGSLIDPDGHPWEVAHNPGWTIAADGSVSLGDG